jgi:hypothetical protein
MMNITEREEHGIHERDDTRETRHDIMRTSLLPLDNDDEKHG